MKKSLRRYIDENKGATAIEYGLLAAGISLAIVAVIFVFGDGLEAVFNAMLPAFDSIAAEVESSR